MYPCFLKLLYFGWQREKSIRCLKKQQRLCDSNTRVCVAFDERWTDWHMYLSWIIESSWNIDGREAEPCLLSIMWLLRLDTRQWSRTQMETLMRASAEISIKQWHHLPLHLVFSHTLLLNRSKIVQEIGCYLKSFYLEYTSLF